MPERFQLPQEAMVKLIGWSGNMVVSNRFLHGVLNSDDGWEEQEQGTVPAPEFIKLRAKGLAKMERGRVFIKK